jgi:hypothetical protein
MSKMGSLGSFEHLKHKLWPKKGPGVEFGSLTPDHKESGIDSSRCLIQECNMALESS